MQKLLSNLWLLPVLILLIVVGAWYLWFGTSQDTLVLQTGHSQAVLQRWVQSNRRLPCPASDADQGIEDCSLVPEKEFYRGALPWKTLGLPRRYGQTIDYRVPQAYVQERIFDRLSSQGLCRSGFYPMQTSATEAAFQLYSTPSATSPTRLLAEARRWHLLPHLRMAAAPQIFLNSDSGREIQWFTRCGALAFPQRKQSVPENQSFTSSVVSLDGSLLATSMGERSALWQRQNNRWQMIQTLHETGQHTRQILFSPDNRWFAELTEGRSINWWLRQGRAANEPASTEATPPYALQLIPADWQAIANAGMLESLFINHNDQWLAAFYVDGVRFWRRVNGGWTLAEGGLTGPHAASNRVLQWNDLTRNSVWIVWNGTVRRLWLNGPSGNARPNVVESTAYIGALHEGSQYLPAPDGSNQLMEVTCSAENQQLTRLSMLGGRYLPVAQHSIAKAREAECGPFVWETMDEILAIRPKEQSIERLTPPPFAPITQFFTQD